jgi:hypothetical protein
MVDSFLVSRKYAGMEHIPVIYYCVGFDSTLSYENLEIRRWEFDSDRPDLTFYKPSILLDSLKYDDHVCYMDSDIVLSKRFNPEILANPDLDFPIASSGPQENVWFWEHYEGSDLVVYNEKKLMRYYGIEARSCAYLWASMITYNRNCIDFIEEWESILSNKYLLKERKSYFPFREETAFNITMWKRGITNFLDLVFFNTVSFESFISIEDEGNIIERDSEYNVCRNDGRLYEVCEDPSKVLFFHGFKPGDELDAVVDWMKLKIN